MAYEIHVVHYALAGWLYDNGFDYEHEVVIDRHNRVDFLARRADTLYVIECKQNCIALETTIEQVLGYQALINLDSVPVVAVPAWSIKPHHRRLCAKRGIELWSVDVPRIAMNYYEDDLLVWAWHKNRAPEQTSEEKIDALADSLGLNDLEF